MTIRIDRKVLIGVGVGLLIAGVIALILVLSNSASSGSVECTVSRSVGGDINVTGSGGVDCGVRRKSHKAGFPKSPLSWAIASRPA